VEQALKNQIITLFETSIIVLDLEHNFENMRNAWDPHQPVETLFKKIQDCVDYAEAGGITIGEAHKLSTAYTKVFSTGNLHIACRRWNERVAPDNTWDNFNIHFAAAYRQYKQM
jgi:hypothetical protein